MWVYSTSRSNIGGTSMKTRDILKAGQSFINQWMQRKEALEALMDQEESAAVKYLLQIQIADTEEKIINTQKKLDLGKRDWEFEMDRNSAEVNAHWEKIRKDGCSYIKMEPRGITDEIERLLSEYGSFSGTPEQDQEKKNDVYFAVKAHIQFIRTRYNKKS